MTREEMLSIYGDTPLLFSGYYKYTFYFSGVAHDGNNISIQVGGNHDDIYRLDVDRDAPKTISDAEPRGVTIRKDGEEIYSHLDW